MVLVLARPAQAGEPSSPLAWGVTAGEITTAAVFAVNFTSDLIPSSGPALTLNFTPLLVGPLVAYGAHASGLDARPALAVHGAGWAGAELFMIGALIDGRDKPFGVRAGRTAWSLGAVGAVGGALLGALEIDGRDESIAWMAAPPAGFLVGGLLIGGAIVIVGGADGDRAGGQLVTGAIAGLAIGLGAATVMAVRGIGDTGDTASTGNVAPRSGVSSHVLSVGGVF